MYFNLSVERLLVLTTLTFCLFVPASNAVSDDKAMDVIVVNSNVRQLDLKDASNNVDVITSADIERVSPVNPADIINRATGLHLQVNNGFDSLLSLRSPVLTGPGAAGAFLFLQDGIATRAAGFANNNGLAELHLSNAQGIEVIRGPSSALFGPNAVHGIVNAISPVPTDRKYIALDIGENEAYTLNGRAENMGVINFMGVTSEQAVGVGVQHSHNGGYRDDSGYDVSKLSMTHSLENDTLAINSHIAYFNLAQETAGFIDSGDNGGPCYSSSLNTPDLYKDKHAMQRNCDPDAFRDWRSLRASSDVRLSLKNSATLTLTPYYRNNDMRFRQHYLPSRAIENNQHSSIGLKTTYQQQVTSTTYLTLGIDAEDTQGTLLETQEIADLYSFGKARQQGVHYDFEVDAFSVSPFAQIEWHVKQALNIVASVRHNKIRYDYSNNISAGTLKADGSFCNTGLGEPVPCLYLKPDDRSDTFEHSSVKLGANYALNTNTAIFAAYASGFRAPQITDLYRLQQQQEIGEIQSEQSESSEIGLRHITNTLRYELSLYTMSKENFFFRDAAGLNVTDAKTSHTGAEIALNYTISPKLDIALNYTFAHHTYDFDRPSSGVVSGNDVDTAPRQLGNIRMLYRPTDTLELELEWERMGSYFLDPSNQHTYAGHNVFNARMMYQENKNLSVRVKIQNISDVSYASRADYAFGGYRFFGGEPINIHAGIRYTF